MVIEIIPFNKKDTDSIIVSNHIRKTLHFAEYWEIRPGKGSTLGKNYIYPFRDEIRKYVEDGAKNRRKSFCASRIQEQLSVIHRHRYDIPSMHYIQSYMNTIIEKLRAAERKSIGVETDFGTEKMRKERNVIPPKYAKLMELLENR